MQQERINLMGKTLKRTITRQSQYQDLRGSLNIYKLRSKKFVWPKKYCIVSPVDHL